jgi:hypothetical protein
MTARGKVGKVSFVYPGANDDYLTEWNATGTSVDEDLLPDEVRDASRGSCPPKS